LSAYGDASVAVQSMQCKRDCAAEQQLVKAHATAAHTAWGQPSMCWLCKDQ
jgi:hypothetical protein